MSRMSVFSFLAVACTSAFSAQMASQQWVMRRIEEATSPSVFYDVAGGAATVSGATLTYKSASNSVGSVALLAGTNVLHITAPSAIAGHVRDFGLTVSTEDAATITLDTSVSWRFDSASTNLSAGSWNRVYCTESPSGVFSLQLWTPDSAQEATP